MIRQAWWLIVLAVLWSCSKADEEPLQAAVKKVLPGEWLSGIDVSAEGVMLACGGIPNQGGKILRSTDQGATWSVMVTHPSKCFYFVKFINDSAAFAGGDYLELWRTTDAGLHWQFYPLDDNVPINEVDRPAFRNMVVQGQRLVMPGGDYAKKGVCYVSSDGGQSWQFTQMYHQMAGAGFSPSGNALACGWGYLGSIASGESQTKMIDYRGDFFTSVVYTGTTSALMSGYSGKIYRTADDGKTWEREFSDNRCSFNQLMIKGNSVLAASDNGLLAMRGVTGGDWMLRNLPVNSRLLHMTVDTSGRLLVVTSGGELVTVNAGSW